VADRPDPIIVDRAHALAGLLDNPAFHELQRAADKKAERVQKVMLAHVMGEDVSQSFISTQKGFIEGMHYITRLVPQGAQADLFQWAAEEEQ